MSGSGKAMSPILSQGNLATITPSSTNPDITDPKFAGQYRPGGKAIYFRTVTTDAFQGPNMANYFADTLKVKSVYVLDDSGAYGVGIADAFQAQAEKRGIKVLGRDQLDPKEADYTTILTKIKSLNPRCALLRRRGAGRGQAGQAVLRHHAEDDQGRRRRRLRRRDPERRRASRRPRAGMRRSPRRTCSTTRTAQALGRDVSAKKYGEQPEDYSITAYDAALVIIDAVKRVAAIGQAGRPRALCATRSRPPR